MKQYRNYSEGGVISIVLSLVFCLMFDFCISLLIMVRKNAALELMDMCTDTGLMSSFSYFDRDLFDEYGILAVKKNEDDIAYDLIDYVTEDLSLSSGLVRLSLNDVCVKKVYNIKDCEGSLFERQIIDNAKYTVPTTLAANVLNKFLNTEENPLEESLQSVKAFAEEEGEFEKELYKLISAVDGIKVNGRDVVDFGDGYIDSVDEFVKDFALNNSQYKVLHINYSPAYVAVTDKIYGYGEKCELMRRAYAEDRGSFDVLLKEFKEKIKVSIENYKRALEIIDNLKAIAKKLDEERQTALDNLKKDKDKMPQGSYETLAGKIEKAENIINIDKNEIVDVLKMEAGLKRNREILERLLDFLIEVPSTEETFLPEFQEALVGLNLYDFSDIEFDYTRLHIYGGDASVSDFIDSLYTDGIFGVVTAGLDVSYKGVSTDYKVNYKGVMKCDGAEKFERILLFDEYVISKFSNYRVKSSKGSALDYQVEYIIGGKNKDSDNLAYVINKIILYRQGLNMISLMSDGEKMEEVSSLAGTICSAGGGPVAVAAVELALISAWAYGESVVDARLLLKGKKIPLYKDASNWKLSLEGLMNGNFDYDEGDEEDDISSSGLSYADHLRYFLFLENYGMKNIGTINMMELEMKHRFDDTFSMNKMSVGADVTMIFNIMSEDSLERNYTFSY